MVISESPNTEKIDAIRKMLKAEGFELIDDKSMKIINQIKKFVIEYIHRDKEIEENKNFSDLLVQDVGYDYSFLSKLFSTHENITLERYVILQKVERIKELISYNNLNLSEIAFQMGYSSVQYLSNQFKQILGITPSQYKKKSSNLRKPLDKV